MRRPKKPSAMLASDYDGPSKSQVKRELIELQEFGESLLELPDSTLDALITDERLRGALRELRRLTDPSARNRQVQYVGKLLREEDLEPVRQALAQRRTGQAQDKRALKLIEDWRERLIADDAALDAWIQAHPASDTPAFRALLRDARRERASQENGRAFRELFKQLRSALTATRPE